MMMTFRFQGLNRHVLQRRLDNNTCLTGLATNKLPVQRSNPPVPTTTYNLTRPESLK